MSKDTIYDIAKKANVSIATVSRVMNKSDNIADKTREKVLKIADKMDYYPQAYAQGLARQTKKNVMAVVPVLSNYFFMEVLEGIQDEISKTDYHLNIYNIKSSGRDMFPEVETILKQQWADGYLFISTHLRDPQLKKLKHYELPITLVDESFDGLDSVSVSNEVGIQKAMEYFLDQGYSRIAMVSALASSKPGEERIEGYKKAMQQKGLAVDEQLIVTGNSMERDGFNEQNGYEAMFKLFNLSPLPEACFCTSDIQAIGALKAMKEQGIRIPLIGYDDITISDYVGLSTIRQPMHTMGSTATEILLERIKDNEKQPVNKIFSPELIVRRSSQKDGKL